MPSTTTERESPGNGMDLFTFTKFLDEIAEQPAWRSKADREMDYYDGNQLDSEILQRQASIGLPPAIEPLIGPAIDSVLGLEVKTRADWRVIPDSDKKDDDIALALNRKLNQAERQAQADRACSDAFKYEVGVGLGWVEVSRESDPFKFPYRCKEVHRNEIWYDWSAREPDLSDARYLMRRKWTDRDQAALLFPEHKDLIESASNGWFGVDVAGLALDGGTETGLAMRYNDERGWAIEEQEWRDIANRRICLFEVWYRIWERVHVLKTPDGRVVEYDKNNDMHVTLVANGLIKPISAIVSRMRRAWYLGPHQLYDGPSPYTHNRFPYVPFWGKLEDRTRAPYGLIRGMMFLQDEVNARISRQHWGLAAVRTTRTEGAVLGDAQRFRDEVARPDADIVLDQKHMRKEGAIFKVDRDFSLDAQQSARLVEAREGINRAGGITNIFKGEQKGQISGVAVADLVEQSTQTLADIHDNFKFGRALVGDLLLSMIIEDMGDKPQEVFVPGEAIRDDTTIKLNIPMRDEGSDTEYLDNDLQRTKMKVVISDVASTPSFRKQQLATLSEAVKSLPENLQVIVTPHLMALMDLPEREAIITAIREATVNSTPEEVAKQVEDAVKEALDAAGTEIKLRGIESKTKVDTAKAVEIGVNATIKALEAAGAITVNPAAIAVADSLIESAAAGLDEEGLVEPPPVAPVPAIPAETLTEGEIQP